MEKSEDQAQIEAEQWYVALGESWIGPLSTQDIYEKMNSHLINWAHYICRSDQSEWNRICDTPPFQATAPEFPNEELRSQLQQTTQSSSKRPVIKKAPTKAKPSSIQRSWFLFFNDSQFGPFSNEEVQRYLKIGKIHGRVHAWKEGMGNWERLEKIEEFKEMVSVAKPAKKPKPEKFKPKSFHDEKVVLQNQNELRINPRRPLVAKIIMADHESVILGICRDISVGGLQVLTEKIPAGIGEVLKMNISPSSEDSVQQLKPFVAEGEIVRILEDGRGFSFRFKKLPDDAKRAIEAYIESPN